MSIPVYYFSIWPAFNHFMTAYCKSSSGCCEIQWGACGLVLAGNAVIFLTILGFFIVFGRGDDFSWEQW
ncbi:hypothetical protein GDO78_019612 [Eleutherodactylus coqui]|uniref:Leptin receptor gene-related protein n=1 Tax=Eleutherodactylus coqui TaxID=57060 RepID=A0A8J6EIY8_ELECQ|nr:hypothetical protein GDO78_019612 [Eleutherodactylus coqui]